MKFDIKTWAGIVIALITVGASSWGWAVHQVEQVYDAKLEAETSKIELKLYKEYAEVINDNIDLRQHCDSAGR